MPDLFQEPRRRVARAKEHIKDLDSDISTFLQEHPWTRVIETDPDAGNKTHKIKLSDPVPEVLCSRAIEIGEGLRAALDGAGFVSAEASGNTRLKKTYFPIADTDSQLQTDVIGRGNCKDLPPEILTLFRSFKPYKDGNYLIWAINQLANGTKHRALAPVGIVSSGGAIDHLEGGPLVRLIFPPRWDPENDEIVIAVFGPTANPQYEIRLGVVIGLRPLVEVRHKPATAVLGAMAGEVERVLMATEAECRRLGWVK